MDNQKKYEGIYGPYSITEKDRNEVKFYRISLLICGISFALGLIQWILKGPELVWIWLFLMIISLGLSLYWIHIYIRELHQALQIFWLIGTINILILTILFGTENLIPKISYESNLLITISPLFISLTGLGFKEFFCFRRLEAIGLTLLIPMALLGSLSKLLNERFVFTLICIASGLLIIMALNKFGTDAKADIGDKSVFEYMKNIKKQKAI